MGNEKTKVVITGLGPVTSIGIGVEPFWRAMLAGRTSVAPRQLHSDVGKADEFQVASMPPALPTIRPHHEFLERIDYVGYRDLAYAMAAIDIALEDAHLEYDRDDNTIGVVQAFEAPGMERTVATMFEACSTMATATEPPCMYDALATYFYNSQPFLYVHAIGKAFGFHGFAGSAHNACSSGAYAIEMSAQRIRSGDTDFMIVVGGEAFDTAVRIEWFRRLELYSTDGTMRPFDAEPVGFYVGEGAAAIILESAESALRRGVTPYAEYVGGSFAQQGWKHSIPDVRASRLRDVIKRTLAIAEDNGDKVDLVIPHGAATTLSDGYEASCLDQALAGRSTDAVASVFKPYVGHMLATSAIIELIAGMLAMRHQVVPATLHTRPSCSKLPIPLVSRTTDRSLRAMLKLSTGFTGHDAASLFRRADCP